MRIRYLFSILAIWLFHGIGLAQSQSEAGPEKVFVHVDRTYFAPGETIWLKGYVENALPAADTSRFLYVELLDGERGESVLCSKIRCGVDGFAGHLDLPDDFQGGKYMLRAYTRWQLNWPEDRMFHVPIAVYDGKESSEPAREDEIDVTFYPEGGRYFNWESASIGFKAMAPDGRSVPLQGALFDDLGTRVCDVRSVHAGMGLLSFTPEADRHYRLVDEVSGRVWNLPAASSEGATLQVRRVDGHFAVRVINRSGGSVALQVIQSGKRIPLAEITEGSRTVPVLVESGGISKFVLLDPQGRILSERAVYVENPSATASLSIGYDTPAYEPRQKWNVRLQLPSEAADSAEVSVSVVRKAFRTYQQEGSLQAYMLLGSEIRGFIEDPDYYFDPAVSPATRLEHLDLLLMIQGWTYYDDSAMLSSVRYTKERVQSLRGEVRSLFKSPPKNYSLAVIAPGLEYSQVADVKRGDRFVADSLDFPEKTVFIIHVENAGAVKRYYPVLDETFAPASAVSCPPPRQPAVTAMTAPRESVIPEVFSPVDFLHDTIQTAIFQDVAPRIRTPFGTSDIPNIKTREEISLYDNRSLLDYLLLSYPNISLVGEELVNLKSGYVNQTIVPTGTDEREEGEPLHSGIALFIDGFRTPGQMAETIPMSDVDRLSVSTYMSSDAFLARSYGGIILVQLRTGADSGRSINRQSNTIVAIPLGWQQPKAFYNPVYDKQRNPSVPDRRNTIYWNPSIRLNAGDTATLPLMTEDRADGPYYLRIEGRTSDGRWISETRSLEGKSAFESDYNKGLGSTNN